MRVVMLVDMNSYFASVEQEDNPEWRGKPLGVCEHLGGIIIAASVEAKRWGIGTGTPVWEAQKLFPKIILSKTHPDRYRYYTKKFLRVLEDYNKLVELYSIDEAYLDVTDVCNIRKPSSDGLAMTDPFDEAVVIAKEIKVRFKKEVGEWLRCSIGVGWNKLTAKIASDRQKPDGLVVYRPQEKEKILETLELTDIPGIAHRQKRNLAQLGIFTLRDLNRFPKHNLIARFGIGGLHLWNMGQLEGSFKEGFTNEPLTSMGHMYTLPRGIRRPELLWPVLAKLCDMVASRLRAADFVAGTIHTYAAGLEGVSVGGSHRLGYLTQDGKDLFLEAQKLLMKYLGVVKITPVRISITASGIRKASGQQALFPQLVKRQRVLAALDSIHAKHGDRYLSFARAFLARHTIRDSVGFGRVKELNGRVVKGVGDEG